jgi:signal peptidase I
MLQVVDDTRHIAQRLTDIGWPLRWQSWAAGGHDVSSAWSTSDHGHTYDTDGLAGQDVWLRYHHIMASDEDWKLIEDGQQPPMVADRKSELITDVYAYNAITSISPTFVAKSSPTRRPEDYADARFAGDMLGLYWVSDLAIEGDVEVKGDQGELLLLLVKGGIPYTCRVDVATGKATLSIDGGKGEFVGSDAVGVKTPVGQTKINGRGTYRIRFSNVDADVRLWVNEQRVVFEGATTYVPRDTLRPAATALDPGDLAPVGIGTRDAALHIQRLRVLRDVYYVATEAGNTPEYTVPYSFRRIQEILHDPESWPETDLFDLQAKFEVTMKADELFPLGDNSPQSSDARMWDEHFVKRDLLIGKALLIYWPHPWYRPIPYLPNFKRMRLIY